MARWINAPAVAKSMLRPPTIILEFTPTQLQTLLRCAAISHYGAKEKVDLVKHDLEVLVQELGELENVPPEGFFVRVSNCSVKDADDGNQKPLYTLYSALLKIISSKRAVHSFLDLQTSNDTIDHKIFFFPYFTGLDKLSEWRCFIYQGSVVAMSQTRFYQNHHSGVKDSALRQMVRQARRLWEDIRPAVRFDSTILDLYADVRESDFEVKLIEMNPWGAHLGTGSLLFHWIDDKDILEPEEVTGKTVLRLVKPRGVSEGSPKYLSKTQVYEIGHGEIVEEEVEMLRKRGLICLLDPGKTRKLMSLPVPGKSSDEITCTREEALARLRNEFDVETERDSEGGGSIEERGMKLHARFKRMQKVYVEQEGLGEESLKEFVDLIPYESS